jgi:hypothetical protein
MDSARHAFSSRSNPDFALDSIVILSGAKNLRLIFWQSQAKNPRCFASLNMTGQDLPAIKFSHV